MRRGARLFGQPTTKDSPVALTPQTPTIPAAKLARHRTKYRIIPTDEKEGLSFNPYGEKGKVEFFNSDNIYFLNVWIKHAFNNGVHQPLTIEAIRAIRDDLYYDSDLWNDVYNNDDIFPPTDYNEDALYDERPNKERLEDSVQDYLDRLELNETLRGKFINEDDAKKYIRSRIKLFKLYIYLRRCAILYRDTQIKQPFLDLITFLQAEKNPGEKKSNFQKFSAFLMVEAVQLVGENWSAGLHEWLTRSQTLEALCRTAGYQREGIATHIPPVSAIKTKKDGTEVFYECTELNWLDIQMLMRTSTKYVQLISHEQTIIVGHTGSVNLYQMGPSSAPGRKTGFKVGFEKGERRTSFSASEMDHALNNLFIASTNILDYVIALHHGYNIGIFNDTTPIRPAPAGKARYLVDGTGTDDLAGLQAFQHTHLVEAHGLFRWTERDFVLQSMLAPTNTA